jgi:hypothetical protein
MVRGVLELATRRCVAAELLVAVFAATFVDGAECYCGWSEGYSSSLLVRVSVVVLCTVGVVAYVRTCRVLASRPGLHVRVRTHVRPTRVPWQQWVVVALCARRLVG